MRRVQQVTRVMGKSAGEAKGREKERRMARCRLNRIECEGVIKVVVVGEKEVVYLLLVYEGGTTN